MDCRKATRLGWLSSFTTSSSRGKNFFNVTSWRFLLGYDFDCHTTLVLGRVALLDSGTGALPQDSAHFVAVHTEDRNSGFVDSGSCFGGHSQEHSWHHCQIIYPASGGVCLGFALGWALLAPEVSLSLRVGHLRVDGWVACESAEVSSPVAAIVSASLVLHNDWFVGGLLSEDLVLDAIAARHQKLTSSTVLSWSFWCWL